ncbi:MAG: NAD(P)-binding protein [Candidatus Micrarchaeota archaeon]
MGVWTPHKLETRKVREELKVLLLLAAALLAYGTIGYSLTLGVGLEKGFGYTVETLALAHSPEAEAAPKLLQITLLLFGVFLVWFISWTFLDLVLEGKLDDYLKEVKSMVQARALKNHYVICGAGRVGIHVAELLFEKGIPFVVIDSDKTTAEKIMRKGFLVIEGDALDEELLEEANIKTAKAVVAVIPETEKNILLTLTAKHLNPGLTVYARAEHEMLVRQLHSAGAKHVVMPEVIGAREMVGFIAKEEETSAKKG